MATYKEVNGTAVQNVAGDPSNPVEGEVWYNSSTGSFRAYKQNTAGAWATATSLNSGRYYLSGAGTQTSGLVFSGISPYRLTESYNGTNWTEVNDLNIRHREGAGCGASNTAALSFGGKNASDTGQNETETWNGSNWTEVANLNTARFGLAGCGTNTAALAFGGRPAPSPGSNGDADTENWNGSSWTEVNDLNTARFQLSGAGTNTSALAFGGQDPGDFSAATELWNGSNWTEVNDLNFPRVQGAGCGASNTAALAFGGQVDGANGQSTESWNGTNWTSIGDLNVGRRNLTGAGTKTAALAVGGEPPNGPPSSPSSTEEFNAPALQIQTITTT